MKNRLSRVVLVGVSLPCVHMCTCERDFLSTVYLCIYYKWDGTGDVGKII